MTGRRRGRGRGRRRDISQPRLVPNTSSHAPSTLSQPRPIPTPTPSHIQTRPEPLPSLHSHVQPTPIPLPHSLSEPTQTSSPPIQTSASANLSGGLSSSSSAQPHPEVASYAPENIRWGRKDANGRTWIRPATNTEFHPDYGTTRTITLIFKKKFEGPWTTWKKVPNDAVKMWFEDFGAKYKWLPQHEEKIKKIFGRKGAGALVNNLNKVRNGKGRTDWIAPEIMEQLRLEWDSESWKEKSVRNSRNRLSKEGLNVHSGGSISATEHAKIMKVKQGKEPSLFDIYRRLHRAKDNPDEYITEESRKIAEDYENRVEELQSLDEGSSQHSENNIYLDVVGGRNKKGRIYGLGSKAPSVLASSSSSFTDVDGTAPDVVALQAQVNALTNELHQKNAEQEALKKKAEEWDQIKQKVEQWDQGFKNLLLADHFRTPSPAPRGEDDHDDDQMVDAVDHDDVNHDDHDG